MDKKFLAPTEAAETIMVNGKRVLTQPVTHTIILSLLAGFYIAFGAQLATVVTYDAAAHVGSGIARFLGGSVFSIGLMLVIICGAELFTGNTLLAKTALQGEIPWSKLASNWAIVILGNFVASILFAWMMSRSGLLSGPIAEHAVNIAARKCNLPFIEALIRGILCNWLVCLAIFMAVAARDVPGKILACYAPIMAFVTSGFEHSVANMYFIPVGIFIAPQIGADPVGMTWPAFLFGNLLPVTIGNIIGGCLFVAGAYWFIHLRFNINRQD
ncbi:MAG: FdhC protein [Desulfuromonas sp.]|nr:MAG: FdhC protein [Desulfuromonas sp.]